MVSKNSCFVKSSCNSSGRYFQGAMCLFCFFKPRSARRVPQPHREYSSEPVFEPEARFMRPASWRVPGGARNAGDRAQARRALRGVLSFGSFSLHEQRKGTCRGSATHKYTPPLGGSTKMSTGGLRRFAPNPPYIVIYGTPQFTPPASRVTMRV